VRRIVEENSQRAKELLQSKKEILERLAQTLLEYEALDAQQIDMVIEGKPLPARPASALESTTDGKVKGKALKPVFNDPPAISSLNEDPEKA